MLPRKLINFTFKLLASYEAVATISSLKKNDRKKKKKKRPISYPILTCTRELGELSFVAVQDRLGQSKV